MKTAELTGAMLDHWVAKAEGMHHVRINEDGEPPYCYMWESERTFGSGDTYSPSTQWRVGGPIIERERIDINTTVYGWEAFDDINHKFEGSTPLVAAMRAYVASKFGDEMLEIAG